MEKLSLCRIVFWAGDLNFRIEKLTREEVITIALNDSSYEKLLEHDQVLQNLFLCVVMGNTKMWQSRFMEIRTKIWILGVTELRQCY